MKFPAIFLLLTATLLTAISCSSNDDEPSPSYYVRYTAFSDPGREVSLYYRNADNDFTVIRTASPDGRFEYAAGPVSSGFDASVTASYTDGGAVRFLSIEVARQSEPFVLKRSSSNAFNISYTVE